MEFHVSHVTELPDVASAVLSHIQRHHTTDSATVLALSGPLGAGKTTFVQALAGVLGSTRTIQSPTFVIQKRYPLAAGRFNQFIHVDAYRLRSADELYALNWEETVADADTCIAIEWPEHVPEAIPAHAWHLTFTDPIEQTRTITLHPYHHGT